jgi:NAD+ synthetase
MVDYKKFVENSSRWLKDYIKKNHLQSLVIGVSGGIDSTVSCAIASPVCEELGISFIGRSLPCNTNKEEETNSANLVGKAFCTDYKEVTIEPMYRVIENELSLNEGSSTHLQSGNIKARLRMIYLRHLASIHKGVVLDNDNFTEWNLGFWTVGGDSPMDINLGLHYLWKTEIYELAGFLYYEYNIKEGVEQSKAILESIKLTPTDGNGVSSSDCEQFGLDNYSQVDDVLKTMYYSDDLTINCDMHPEYIRLIDSYNEQGVDKVMVLHQNTAYKRKELPIKPTKEELGL